MRKADPRKGEAGAVGTAPASGGETTLHGSFTTKDSGSRSSPQIRLARTSPATTVGTETGPIRVVLPNKAPIWSRVPRNRRDIQHNQASSSARAHLQWALAATDPQLAEADREWGAFWAARAVLLKCMDLDNLKDSEVRHG